MVRPVMLVIGAIPAVLAILLVVPLLTQPDIPFSAVVPQDNIEVEYTVHDLRRVSFGVTDQIGADRTSILTVQRNGDVRLFQTRGGFSEPTIRDSITEDEVIRLMALIKETGFIAMPEDTFPVRDNATEYTRHTVKITLNGAEIKVTWPEQNATDRFIPPIITQVESTLDSILENVRDR